MSGIGVVELMIIVAIVVLLFGAPVATFLIGYALGRKRASTTEEFDIVAVGQAEPPSRQGSADE